MVQLVYLSICHNEAEVALNKGIPIRKLFQVQNRYRQKYVGKSGLSKV